MFLTLFLLCHYFSDLLSDLHLISSFVFDFFFYYVCSNSDPITLLCFLDKHDTVVDFIHIASLKHSHSSKCNGDY